MFTQSYTHPLLFASLSLSLLLSISAHPTPSPTVAAILHFNSFCFSFLHLFFLHALGSLTLIFFHDCFSKTLFTLSCGPWRMWSQGIGKVSGGCAMPTHISAIDTRHLVCPLSLWPSPFLLSPGIKECVCVWLWHLHILHHLCAATWLQIPIGTSHSVQ